MCFSIHVVICNFVAQLKLHNVITFGLKKVITLLD